MTARSDIAVVAIGRNEGQRLHRSLASVLGKVSRIVYVDSGSSDASVEFARSKGVEVVELDPSRPFSAARARNEGFQALGDTAPEFVQFIDGDCELVDGWLEAAMEILAADESLALVTGWRAELYPEASIYNAICHQEWRRPAGEIPTCGGDMMVRSAAFASVNGMREDVIAAEDDEFCQRLRAHGWRLWRHGAEMTRHDAHMLHFVDWWRRARRSGHGFAQVGALHPGFFRRERMRVLAFGVVLPILFVLALLAGSPLVWVILAIYGFSFARTLRGQRQLGLQGRDALKHAGLLFLSKFPNALGMGQYFLRRLSGRAIRIIEYK